MTSTQDVACHETIELRSFVDGLLADFRTTARSRHVALDALVFSDQVRGDPSLLRRLLTDLVAGALRRAPAGTTVSIVVSPRGPCTEFRVADEGAGIVQTREAVFDDGRRALQADGSGLAYCRQAAEASGGGLSVVETDAGTVVCLSLPSDASAGANFSRESGVHARFGRASAQ